MTPKEPASIACSHQPWSVFLSACLSVCRTALYTHNNVDEEEEVRETPWEVSVAGISTVIGTDAASRKEEGQMTHRWRYHSWSLHWVVIRRASAVSLTLGWKEAASPSMKVTTMRKRARAGTYGRMGWD